MFLYTIKCYFCNVALPRSVTHTTHQVELAQLNRMVVIIVGRQGYGVGTACRARIEGGISSSRNSSKVGCENKIVIIFLNFVSIFVSTRDVTLTRINHTQVYTLIGVLSCNCTYTSSCYSTIFTKKKKKIGGRG